MAGRHILTVATLVGGALLAGCLGGDRDTDLALDDDRIGGGFSTTHIIEGVYDLDGPFSRVLQPGALFRLGDEVLSLSSRVDGEPIQIGLVRPAVAEGERVPVVVYASVYLPVLREGDLSNLYRTSYPSQFLVENFVPRGYAVAFVAARGTSGSGGCWDGYSPLERADLDQAITWLGEQSWSSGNVGMIGKSYDGVTQWHVAATGNPYLKTIVPVSSEPDLYSFFVRNGTASTLGAPGNQLGFWGMATTGNYVFLYGPESPFETRSPDRVASAACPDLANGLASSLYVAATGERDPTGFWASRDLRPLVEANYRGSVFLVHGLQDSFAQPHLVQPWIQELEGRDLVVKQWLGQWSHDYPDWETTSVTSPRDLPNPTRRMDWAEVLIHWFDYWLKNDTAADLGPRIQVADSSGAWRSEAAWPPTDATPSTFQLASEGRLVRETSTTAGTVLVGPDPVRMVVAPDEIDGRLRHEAFATCPGCVAFSTPELDDELRFAGLPTLHATVTPTGPGGHLTARLLIQDEESLRPVGVAQMDLRYAAGGDEPTTVVPNQPLVARMEFEPLDVVVPPGARLVLQLSQGGYGFLLTYFRSPIPTYPVQVHTGANASTLTLQSFERPSDAFFTPPGVVWP